MSAPVHTFISVEEDKHTLTVYYRTEAGEPGEITFSRRGEPEGYSLELVGVGGRRIQEKLHVDMYFRKDGVEAVEVMQVTDKNSIKIRDGVLVTHHIVVELAADDAHKLSKQLHLFINPVEVLLESNMLRRPVMDGISYGGDYIAVSYDSGYRTVRFGLVADRHRFTLAYYAVNFEENVPGPQYMTFGFLDEDGIKRHLNFSAPTEDIWRMKFELSAFVEAFEKQHNPKFEAADLTCTFPKAA
jgi:hypothetical protein